MIKNKKIKIIVMILLLFVNNDATAFMESLEDLEQNSSNDSWSDWFYNHKNKILIGFALVLVIGTTLYVKTYEAVPVIPFEIFEKFEPLMLKFEKVAPKLLTDEVREIFTKVIEKQISKDFGITLLEIIFKTFGSDPHCVDDPEKVNKIIKVLIKEIKKL